jgi:hypothetical protein
MTGRGAMATESPCWRHASSTWASRALIFIATACATPGAPVPEPGAALAAAPGSGLAGVRFERVVSAAFPVLDESGRPYALPFLGGIDAPRPQLVDIDGDGDHDLFLQAYSNDLWFFENTGTAAAPKYEWRTDRYRDLDIGEWFRFVDLDADGDADLLAEHQFSHIRFYRNIGDPTAAAFQHVDSLRDADGTAIFLDRQNVPALVDVDCDRRLDFFVGRVSGTVARYEAIAPGAERFAFVSEPWEGIEIIGQIDTTGTQRHGANALAFADVDGDGDQDLFWGDFFERGVLLIENIGPTCSTPAFQVEPVLLWADSINTSGYNAPAPVDLDRDGDTDFVMGVIGGAYNPVLTASDNLYLWERTSPDRFSLRTTRMLHGIDLGSESAGAFGDVDGDGDLDLVAGNKIDRSNPREARLFLFRNDGSPSAPRFSLADTLPIRVPYNLAPALGDLDADGDADLLLGTWNADILYFRNEGTPREPRWIQDTALTIRAERVTNAVPALADIDGDGDLDLFVGEANGEVNFVRNEGTPSAPRFVVASDRLDDIDVGRRSAPAVVDLDGDGLLDLGIGREQGGIAFYRNAGTRGNPRFVPHEGPTLSLPPISTPMFVDLDGDGVPDVVSGSVGGGFVFYRGVRGER